MRYRCRRETPSMVLIIVSRVSILTSENFAKRQLPIYQHTREPGENAYRNTRFSTVS